MMSTFECTGSPIEPPSHFASNLPTEIAYVKAHLDSEGPSAPEMTVHITDCLGNGQLPGANVSRLAAKRTAAQMQKYGVKFKVWFPDDITTLVRERYPEMLALWQEILSAKTQPDGSNIYCADLGQVLFRSHVFQSSQILCSIFPVFFARPVQITILSCNNGSS